MQTVVTLDEFRENLSDLVGQVMRDNQIIRVGKHNKIGVIVLNEQEYKRLKAPQQHFSSKKDSDKLFIVADKVRERMSEEDQKDLNQILDEEIQAVRSNMKHDK